MEGQPPVSVERASRWSQWFARLTSTQTRRVALLLVLVATAAFGGLDTVDKRVTVFKPGEEFNDGQSVITVERARLVSELKGGGHTMGPAAPGKRYLGVVTTIQNNSTVPARLRNEFDLLDKQDQEFFGVYRNRDGSPIQALGPGLTESLAFVWVLPENAVQPGLSVRLRVWEKRYTQLMVTYGGKEWIDDLNHYGETTVPVAS